MNRLFLPRGIRNNNPGNIRISPQPWQGQVLPPQNDVEFVEFTAPLYGLRALMRTLITYHLKYGLDTAESIINRYAPPFENATDAYVYAVAQRLKVKRTQKIKLTSKPVLITLARAIVRHENGAPPSSLPPDWYEEKLYEEAADLVLSSKKETSWKT